MANIDEISLILYRLAEAYGYTMTRGQIRNYHLALQTYPRLVLVQAVDQLMRTVKFFPRIAEIAQAAQSILPNYALEPTTEQMFWTLYKRNLATTDDLSEEDVTAIYLAADDERVQPIMTINELSFVA